MNHRETSQHPAPSGAPVICSCAMRQRDPTIFTGEDDTDVEDWLSSYERVGPAGSGHVTPTSLEAPQRVPAFHPSLAVPRFTGYDDFKSVADFLSGLNVYKMALGASDEFVLTRVLPVALEASAGRWWRLQTPFASWADFEARFREELLPPDYDYRIRRELEARTQHPRVGLLEYIRAIQELFKRAIPGASDAETVKHVLRRCHPCFRPFLHGRDYSSLEEMARSARAIEDALISELSYLPPPPVGEALEPACAWRDTYETSPQRSPQPRALHRDCMTAAIAAASASAGPRTEDSVAAAFALLLHHRPDLLRDPLPADHVIDMPDES
ncbi:activity-regulated cytoskeleton-associated protein-like [Haemaphysalis longicornis]